jgi:Sec-independent protein translocase protein TatA
MDFLGIGPAELLLIFLVIILVIGPKDIGKTARSIGRFLNRLYKSDEWRTITQASKTIRTLPNRLAREAELEELNKVKSELEETKKDLQETKRDLDADAKMIKEAQKDLIEETKAIDKDMKAWVEPLEKETAMAAAVAPEEPAHQESQKEIVQENPPEDMPQDE